MEMPPHDREVIEALARLQQSLVPLPTETVMEEKDLGDIRRDTVVKKLIDALWESHELWVSGGPDHNGRVAAGIFNGSGTGKTYLSINFVDMLQDYLLRYPSQFEGLRKRLDRVRCLRVYHKQYHGRQMPDDEKDYKFFLSCTLAGQLAHTKQTANRIESVDIRKLIRTIDQNGLRALFQDVDLVMAAIKEVQGSCNNDNVEDIWIFFSHDMLQEFTYARTERVSAGTGDGR